MPKNFSISSINSSRYVGFQSVACERAFDIRITRRWDRNRNCLWTIISTICKLHINDDKGSFVQLGEDEDCSPSQFLQAVVYYKANGYPHESSYMDLSGEWIQLDSDEFASYEGVK